jgi:hypothetical protein
MLDQNQIAPAILIAMRELVRPTKTPSRGIGFLADIK